MQLPQQYTHINRCPTSNNFLFLANIYWDGNCSSVLDNVAAKTKLAPLSPPLCSLKWPCLFETTSLVTRLSKPAPDLFHLRNATSLFLCGLLYLLIIAVYSKVHCLVLYTLCFVYDPLGQITRHCKDISYHCWAWEYFQVVQNVVLSAPLNGSLMWHWS